MNQTIRNEENRPVVTMPKGNQSLATSQASSSLQPSAVQEQPHVQQPGRGQPLENQAFHPMMMMPPQPHVGYYAWPGAGVGQGFQAPAGPYYPERYFFQEKGQNVPFNPAQFSRGMAWGQNPQHQTGSTSTSMEVDISPPAQKKSEVISSVQSQSQPGADPEYDNLMSKFSKFLQAERQERLASSKAAADQGSGISSPGPSSPQVPVTEGGKTDIKETGLF